jgi:mono/diheme cytochrome c family protein
MKRLLTTGIILGFAVAAFALGAFAKVAQDTYKFPAGSAAASAKCSLCHTSKMGGKLNGYGMDVKAALKGSKALTPAVLHSVEALDSNKDGVKNGDALKAGKLPG